MKLSSIVGHLRFAGDNEMQKMLLNKNGEAYSLPQLLDECNYGEGGITEWFQDFGHRLELLNQISYEPLVKGIQDHGSNRWLIFACNTLYLVDLADHNKMQIQVVEKFKSWRINAEKAFALYAD